MLPATTDLFGAADGVKTQMSLTVIAKCVTDLMYKKLVSEREAERLKQSKVRRCKLTSG